MNEKGADLVLKGGVLVFPDACVTGSVAIREGTIVAIGADGAMPAAREVIDATGLHVLPGVIDCHVHFREPGSEDLEDWETGTAAAACGGVTTVFEMPSTDPPVDSDINYRSKENIARKKSFVDFGLYGLIAAHNLENIYELSECGVIGFKCFMSSSLSGKLPAPDDGSMMEGFGLISRTGKRCAVHAENLGIVTFMEKKLREAGRTDPLAHAESRPGVAAAEAVSRAIMFAEHTGMRLHIAHESARESLAIIRAARQRGVDVTVETCPQYLLLNGDDVAEKGGVLRCNPPIREPGHDAALWKGILNGDIDILATDHAPHHPKNKTHANIWDNTCGLLGVETACSLMLTEVNRGRLSISRFVQLTSCNPAKAWDLYPRKGALHIGADADITLVDLNRDGVIDESRLQSKTRISGWHGRKVKGAPVGTIVRGAFVMRDGEVVGRPGWGRPVRQNSLF